MHREPKSRRASSRAEPFRSFWLVGFAWILALCSSTSSAQIDPAINRDVWRMLFNVQLEQMADPAWLSADDDGDGITNGSEIAAGTSPFSPASTLVVSSIFSNDDSSLTLEFPTSVGKRYIVQAKDGLGDGTAWANLEITPGETLQTVGNGSKKTLSAPLPARAQTFYRISVEDIDSDSDGVSDWAEKITGYDPASAHSHGAAQGDATALAADLARENVVSVVATKTGATQPATASLAASDPGTIEVRRDGKLRFSTITVPLRWSGTALSGVDYAAMPALVTFPPKVGAITLTIVPLANSQRITSATATASALPGGGYGLAPAHAASVAIAPAGNATGSGLSASYYQQTGSPASYSPALFDAAKLKVTRNDPTVNFALTSTTPVWPPTGLNATNFVVRWAGQVQPQYSETYYFSTKTDDGVKLWINGQLLLDGWSFQSAERVAAIPLQAGVLYDIRMEYYQAASAAEARLYWYSASRTKQVIPTERLYPAAGAAALPAITSPATAVGFVNQPFSFQVTATNSGSPVSFNLGENSSPLPQGLSLNSATGLISGTPTLAGEFQVALTATNANGVGAGVLKFQILNAGSGVTRDLWQNVPGTSIADIPFNSPPSSTDNDLTTLEDSTAYSERTGERLRGYFTAPSTGNYYFWLAANNAAQLWISNDAEPVNKVLRSWVTPPGTAAQTWNDAGQPRQRSPWLALVAGQRYYYEVLHNSGSAGDTDTVAVAWLQDPTGTATSPATGVIPGYLLSKYDNPTTTAASGELYGTNLSPQGTAVSSATGSANLRMLPGNTQAILHFKYNGLSSSRTAYHIHIAPDNTGNGPIIFDLDDVDKFHPELITEDGGYIWHITDSGAFTQAQIVAAIQQGSTYFNVHTVNYPNGEVRGFFTRVQGSQNAPTLVPDPGYTDDHTSDAGAARFLNQAAFGAAPSDLASVKAGGFAAWIESQIALEPTRLLPDVQDQATRIPVNPFLATIVQNAWWRAAVTAPDQLRQRVAFALSEILVVSSSNGNLANHAEGLASYYDMLAENAFGNFRDLLKAATLHPTMGYWLNMQGNAPGNLATGYHPNENYAREILQLFSTGLNRLWPDGTLVLDSQGNLVPNYDQDAITNGFARVFTGWTWNQALQGSGQLPTSFGPAANYIKPMVMVKKFHELGPKTLLDNVVLPPATGYSPTSAAVAGSQADPSTAAYDSYCLQDLEKGLDSIFHHPNVGPFICRQLIQRLVASHPSPAYLHRVVQIFNDDGSPAHVRGNLAAVIRAILLDGEARDSTAAAASTLGGKQREPLLRITGPARTFFFGANSGTYSQSGSQVIRINTANPHRFIAGESLPLNFTENATGTPPVAPLTNPTTANYAVLSNPAPTANSFFVNATGVAATTFNQPANSNTLTVNTNGPPVNGEVYLKFLSGNVPDGVYTVTGVPDSSHFTVTIDGAAPTTALTGSVLLTRAAAYFVTSGPGGTTPSTITLITTVNGNFNVGDRLWAQTSGQSSQLANGEWVIQSVKNERQYTLANSAVYSNLTSAVSPIYPLVAPPLSRSGSVALPSSKFDMGNTDGLLVQTPLHSPTVFNFFYPDYQFPGSLSANNVTTPEFQLTTDTNIVNLSNTVASTVLASSNPNGLSNFKNGTIYLDLGAYMSAPYVSTDTTTTTSGTKVTSITTTTVDATALVRKLGDVLTGGMLSPEAKNAIIRFLNNTTSFPITTTAIGTTASPPAAPAQPTTSARDKVRAAVNAILVSPEYAIQK